MIIQVNLRFFGKKLFTLFLSVLFIATLTFILMKVIPGDPFMQEQAIPEEIMEALYKHYGLDKPWYEQYYRYINGIFHWDFGPSFKYEGRQVTTIIKESFPVSFWLGLEAVFIAFWGGVVLGTISAINRGK